MADIITILIFLILKIIIMILITTITLIIIMMMMVRERRYPEVGGGTRPSLKFLQLLMDQLAPTLPHCHHYHSSGFSTKKQLDLFLKFWIWQKLWITGRILNF